MLSLRLFSICCLFLQGKAGCVFWFFLVRWNSYMVVALSPLPACIHWIWFRPPYELASMTSPFNVGLTFTTEAIKMACTVILDLPVLGHSWFFRFGKEASSLLDHVFCPASKSLYICSHALAMELFERKTRRRCVTDHTTEIAQLTTIQQRVVQLHCECTNRATEQQLHPITIYSMLLVLLFQYELGAVAVASATEGHGAWCAADQCRKPSKPLSVTAISYHLILWGAHLVSGYKESQFLVF